MLKSARGLVVRDARDEDLGSIRDIYAHYVLHGTGTFELEPPSVEEMRQRLEAVRDKTLPWLVAGGPSGECLGFAYAAPFRQRPAYTGTIEDSVYVAPESQGAGIGTALLRELLDRSRRLGFKEMLALIGDSANEGSIGLHEACGFARVGTLERVGHKFGRWLDVVIMQCSLDARH